MKSDLLGECNDQKISEVEFTSIFCKRCKNKRCDRAGWSSSSWEERISTQAERFLYNPNIAVQSESSRWEGIVDFELFQAPTSTEVWGVPQTKEIPTKKEVDNTLYQIDVKPKEEPLTRDKSETPVGFIPSDPSVVDSNNISPDTSPSIVENNPPTRQMNTAPQEIIIGGLDSAPKAQPKKPVDDWAVPQKKLKIGGTFKMGG